MDKELNTEKLEVLVGKRVVHYHLTRAMESNRPILIILHGHGFVKSPAQFRSPNWNVVCPIDNFGVNNWGSWFLGEQGDFFWLDAMKAIIDSVREKTGRGKLFFWGSSMGGYGALLHGRLNQATAVYANVPQTWLLGSNYSEGGQIKYFEPIFGDRIENKYNDLKYLFESRSRTKYFLCFNQLERGRYFSQQGLAFVEKLDELQQPFYLEVRPIQAHGKNHGISESIGLFNKYLAAS